MAGYMTKQQGYVYEGEFKNGSGAAVQNGELVVQNENDGALEFAQASASESEAKFLLKEIGTIYDGMAAYRFVVESIDMPIYFVENGAETAETLEYDNANYEFKAGELLRAHPLLVGEEFVTTLVNGQTLTAGQEYGITVVGAKA